MTRTYCPPSLRGHPFTVAEARLAGLTHDQLKGRAWRRLGAGVYCAASLPDSPWLRLAAAAGRLPPPAAFSGLAAAYLHGLDIAADHRIVITVPPDCLVSGRIGMTVWRAWLNETEVVVIRGWRTTIIERTLLDLARTQPLVEAVVVADQALHAALLTPAQLAAYAASKGSRPGVARLRRVLELADGAAESPMETRLRLLLVLAGLPPPELQTTLRDPAGAFLARADLYYPGARLVLEFDGGTHRTSLIEDNRRQNRLIESAYRVLRFTSADLRQHPDLVVAQVAQALGLASPRLRP